MARKKSVKPAPIKKVGFFKRIFNLVKNWVVGNGIEGFLGLILGLILLPLGFKFYSGIAFGVFATRNWDLFKNWVKGLLK
tara:strand:- start:358 stop:597 length:240 start_codon:yes stop_codon:yes gene_type:complete